MLGYPGRPKVITSVLKNRRKRQKKRIKKKKSCDDEEGSERCYVAGFEDGGREPWAKECEQPPEAGKHKEMDSLQEPLRGTHCCWPLNFNTETQVRLNFRTVR